MKYEIIKVKNGKLIKEKFYLQIIADDCVKIAVVEVCSGKKTGRSVVGSLEDTFAGFCQ